ncbi:hypothetical protein E4U21_001057 [Claviceps maximensis]|nr:hypothetical protein E4U21_001057 [Claviceps maximensis]
MARSQDREFSQSVKTELGQIQSMPIQYSARRQAKASTDDPSDSSTKGRTRVTSYVNLLPISRATLVDVHRVSNAGSICLSRSSHGVCIAYLHPAFRAITPQFIILSSDVK